MAICRMYSLGDIYVFSWRYAALILIGDIILMAICPCILMVVWQTLNFFVELSILNTWVMVECQSIWLSFMARADKLKWKLSLQIVLTENLVLGSKNLNNLLFKYSDRDKAIRLFSQCCFNLVLKSLVICWIANWVNIISSYYYLPIVNVI